MGGGGEGVKGGAIFTFLFTGLIEGIFGLHVNLLLAFLSSIHLYLPSQARVLLLQCVHLLDITLLKISEFLLHLGLSFKDNGKVNLVCANIF